MRKINEILRLRHQAELSQREIANALRLSVGVVNKYLNAAAAADIGWPLPDLSEPELKHRIKSRDDIPTAATPAQPDFILMHSELKKKGVTRQLLWEEYVADHPTHHYKYSQYCHLYHQWCKRQKLSMRQTHQAGDKMFVDYAGPTVPIINAETGETSAAQIFVAVLGASNYTFAEATLTQQLQDWIGSHVRAFEYFGGVPRTVVPDNLKSAVSRSDRYEPVLNRTYEEMLTHYGTFGMPTRPRKPKDKPKVEVAVQIVERFVLAKLRNSTFFSLAELNAAIKDCVAAINAKVMRKIGASRAELLQSLDRPALKDLPATPYEYAEWKRARVAPDYHIDVAGHFYSVHSRLIREIVEARITSATVEIFHKGQRVAAHAFSPVRGRHTTLPEHMPSAHRRYAEWTPGRMMTEAARIGPATVALFAAIMKSKPHPEQGFRSCLGILRLEKSYGADRIEAAAKRGNDIGATTCGSITSILRHGLDKAYLHPDGTPAAEPAPSDARPIHHANIRGRGYYH